MIKWDASHDDVFSLEKRKKKDVPEATQTCVLQRIVKYGGTASGIFGSRAYYSEC